MGAYNESTRIAILPTKQSDLRYIERVGLEVRMRMGKQDNDQSIDNIILSAIEYRRRFGKSLGITGEVGEYKAFQILHLKLADGNINRGFDAKDQDNKRVQIKSRIIKRTSERTEVFNNYSFDYTLLVLLSDDYEISEIHKASRNRIKQEIQTQKYKKPALSISKFKQISRQIYP